MRNIFTEDSYFQFWTPELTMKEQTLVIMIWMGCWPSEKLQTFMVRACLLPTKKLKNVVNRQVDWMYFQGNKGVNKCQPNGLQLFNESVTLIL